MAGFLTATWKGNLFPEGFFHLADFLLHFPGYLFSHTFAFQVGIVRQFAHLFLTGALYFVNLARDLILSTWLHLVPLRTHHVKKGEGGYLFISRHNERLFAFSSRPF